MIARWELLFGEDFGLKGVRVCGGGGGRYEQEHYNGRKEGKSVDVSVPLRINPINPTHPTYLYNTGPYHNNNR